MNELLFMVGAGAVAYAAIKAIPGAHNRREIDQSPAYYARSVDVVARTIWGEARGEGYRGMQAVANVITYRANNPGWWGHDFESVCLKPWQFSVWNEGDPNRDLILNVTANDPAFSDALEIASKAVLGELEDVTGGAHSYYNPAVVQPYWADSMREVAVIGTHRFMA